ncbi:glycoside hydrolase family 26 protein [Gillisia sp. M10.2A]|uniref:Mannan endo-1,4-beta-mannosidase n=1 Tax=Gillisia lutea TaxID=2909668 RepID=A0ABS9EI92_9FLAO|nr:glycosyl hydrolase [Gillisia lutea]MCF4101178.1 glycoside hydrolase family 26 protein [Gillisia lutea]
MKYFIKISAILSILFLMQACKSLSTANFKDIKLADDNASNQTKALYLRIQNIAKKGIAFGHQDATAYGIGWKHNENSKKLRSDIKEVSGRFPAVQGFDLGHIELGNSTNLDTVSFSLMKDHIVKMHKKGAIITFSWHLDNPVTNKDSWDSTPAVAEILKGGSEREKYELWIRRLSQFLNSLKDKNNNAIPVVFRPYHEMNGGWFWWGAGNCTPEEYKELWRQTLSLLKSNNVHNVLYAFSPNTLNSEQDFDLYYPGDEYVDILGVDIYNHSGDEAFTNTLKNNLEIIKRKAQLAKKPYALTESGNVKAGSNPKWWSEGLYPGIKDSGIAWVLLWRNARVSHYFSTYKQEASANDFKEFEQLEEILFLNEVKKISY